MTELSKRNRRELEAARARSGAGPVRRAPAKLVTVLHIEDDPNDVELLRAATRRADVQFNVVTVEDGEDAMAYLNGAEPYSDRSQHPFPALILLDLKMPRATGLDILKWIREHPECGNVPVLVLSGSELHEDIRRAYETGANSYLIKPLGFEELVALVKDVDDVWLPAG
jgi:CheY-like chemotaxis protein